MLLVTSVLSLPQFANNDKSCAPQSARHNLHEVSRKKKWGRGERGSNDYAAWRREGGCAELTYHNTSEGFTKQKCLTAALRQTVKQYKAAKVEQQANDFGEKQEIVLNEKVQFYCSPNL